MNLSSSELKRYNRHLLLPDVGVAGQLRLKKARVLVVGAGGLGSPALQYLAAAGIGHLGIVDFDKVEESNLQRQTLFTTDDIGKLKVHCAADRLAKMNPEIEITVYDERLTTKNALTIFRDYEVILDGTDNFATRYLINDACVLLNKPLVYGALFRFSGQVSVFNLGGMGPTYRCLFPDPPSPESAPDCATAGVLGVLPGIIGTLQATEVIKIILQLGESLSGKLLTVDTLTMEFMTLAFERNEQRWHSFPSDTKKFETMNYESFCNGPKPVSGDSVSGEDFLSLVSNNNDCLILDVRELHEDPELEFQQTLRIPMHELPSRVSELGNPSTIVVVCQQGSRSKTAIKVLNSLSVRCRLLSLDGGVEAWEKFKSTITHE